MCSNMCARPVLPIGSCTDPAFTLVLNENTGALLGRTQTITVSPLASFLTVTRLSKAARSCAEHAAAIAAITTIAVSADLSNAAGRMERGRRDKGTRDVE